MFFNDWASKINDWKQGVKEKVQNGVQNGKDHLNRAVDIARDKVNEVGDKVKQSAQDAKQNIKDKVTRWLSMRRKLEVSWLLSQTFHVAFTGLPSANFNKRVS